MTVITIGLKDKPQFTYYKLFESFTCSICDDWFHYDVKNKHPCHIAWHELNQSLCFGNKMSLTQELQLPPTWPYADIRSNK